MEILQLRYFYESAVNESFAKTAKKYMVPTSSVSASVKRLEEEMNCQLFDRESNKIILNQNGKKLQRSLCHIFQELDETVEEISKKESDTREIKMLVRAMRRKVTDYIIEYNKNTPEVSFKTVFDFGDKGFEEYDIIIDEGKADYPEYERFEIWDMKIKMKASKDSPLKNRVLTLKELSKEPFVSLSEDSNMHKMLMRACRSAGFDPNISVISNDIACHDKLIESGMGIGLGREEKSENTVFLNITDFEERYTVYAYYKKGAYYGNVKSFLNFLKEKRI